MVEYTWEQLIDKEEIVSTLVNSIAITEQLIERFEGFHPYWEGQVDAYRALAYQLLILDEVEDMYPAVRARWDEIAGVKNG